MILFDVTKASASRHSSGLQRVSRRLGEELGAAARPARWPEWGRGAASSNWLFTAELLSEAERPGLSAFLDRRPCRCAALFHDAIPLQHPEITWPRSVERHPGYVKLLARFDRVWAVSDASARILRDLWRWQGVEGPEVGVLPLGADFNRAMRAAGLAGEPARRLVCTGILEPRKNQALLLDACERLWGEGLDFELRLIGRVNPHFGPPIAARVRALQRRRPGLRWSAHASDADLAEAYRGARAGVFPTIAEGCGLPLLESLWMGVPCLHSDLPVLAENARGGGCAAVPVGDVAAWSAALRRILTDDGWRAELASSAAARPLPTWAEAAGIIREALK